MEIISDTLNDMKDNAVWVEEDLEDVFAEAQISPEKQHITDFT